MPFALTDYAEAMDVMDTMIERREPGYVCAAAVHVLMVSRHDPKTRAALRTASLVVPDGRPLVWALNLLGARLPDRVYGPELTVRYCARAAERGHRVWLYGGATPAALTELERALAVRFPGIRIAGGESPPHRPLTEAEERALAERIDADAPDVVWVGIGAPKQELWMAAHAPPHRGAGARRRRRRLRLHRGPQAPGAGLDAARRPRVAFPDLTGPPAPRAPLPALQPGLHRGIRAPVRPGAPLRPT